MIKYDAKNIRWTISNNCSTYKIGLKDNKLHHICYLPDEYVKKIDYDRIMNKEHQPEAEVHINNEGRQKHHGVSFTGCSASSRAVFKDYKINKNGTYGYEVLAITSLDEKSGLEIDNKYTIYDNSDAITRQVVLRNTSASPINIQHLASYALYGFPYFANNIPGKEVLIHSFPSSWCWEGQMKTMTAEEAGLFNKFSMGCWHVENTGSWSCKEYAPFFLVEEVGQKIFWCMQIEHSGSWRFEIGGPGFNDDGLHIQGGLGNYTYAHWSKRLMPGEEFESIKVSISCTHGDIDDALNSMHKHRANVLIKRSEGDKSFPVIFNEWNSTNGAVREETIEKHLKALKNTGVDVYAIDAGWFLKYHEKLNPGDWFMHAGDWEPHPSRFPNGIKASANKIIENGMIPGIWVEIEIAADCSQAFSDNTRYFMKNETGFVEDNHRRFLYFGDAETRKYATNVFEKLIDVGFRYFKIDYNTDCGLGCNNSGDSLGQGLLDNIRGYYVWLDDLRAKYPDIIIENCSSGGNRLDYGLLARSDLSSITDQGEWFRLSSVFYGVSKYIHPSQIGNWSILKDAADESSYVFTLINSMMGRMHISGEIENLSPAKRKILTEAIAFYKKWNAVLEEPKLYHHTPNASLQYTEGWLVLQMNDSAASKLLVGAWRLKSDDSKFTVKLKEINSDSKYKVTSFPEKSQAITDGSKLGKGFDLQLNAEFNAILCGIEKI